MWGREVIWPMRWFVFRRFAFALVTAWAVVSVTFLLLRLAPGGPFDGERPLPAAVEANLRAAYHLDESLGRQYWRYLSSVATGDLGPSFRQRDFSVNELLGRGLPVSLAVGGLALAFALGVGALGGAWAGWHRDSMSDRVVVGVATLGLAFPPIIVAPVLVLVFAVTLRWLPAGGNETVLHYLLPAVALGLPYVAAFARLARGGVIEALGKPHVRTAWAKGMPSGRVFLRHVAPVAGVPVLSFLGPAAAALLAGSMVVEEVFSLPGLGRYFVQGALNRDYTLVMGTVIVYAGLVLTFNFLVDVGYSRLDPRIRHG